jgi:hypothetical protein
MGHRLVARPCGSGSFNGATRLPLVLIVAALLLLGPLAGLAPAAGQASRAPSEAEVLLAAARDAIDSNHLAEAIRAYVGVLAIAERESFGRSAAELDASVGPARIAAAELAKIGERLSIEPSSEWLDAKGGQVAGSTRGVSRPGALAPAVHLYENFGTGKSPVADAPIRFEFAENSGSLVSPVATDQYGRANTTIARLDDPARAARIRAYPRFDERGAFFAFATVFRDFAFLPTAITARVAVLEISELGASESPQTVDALVAALGPLGLRLAPAVALAPSAFRLAFGGDKAALAALGAGGEHPDAALAVVEVTEIRQVELNGKKYNIFTAQAKAAFRFLASDGTALFALPVEGLRGQGGTREAAAADGLRRAREAMMAELRKRMSELGDAVSRD